MHTALAVTRHPSGEDLCGEGLEEDDVGDLDGDEEVADVVEKEDELVVAIAMEVASFHTFEGTLDDAEAAVGFQSLVGEADRTWGCRGNDFLHGAHVLVGDDGKRTLAVLVGLTTAVAQEGVDEGAGTKELGGVFFIDTDEHHASEEDVLYFTTGAVLVGVLLFVAGDVGLVT